MPFGEGYNNIEIQMWWMNECENGVDLVSLVVEKVTGEEEPAAVVHNYAYTTDDSGTYVQEAYKFKLNDYIADVAQGDKVKITATFSGTAGFGGAIQGNIVDAENANGYSWKTIASVTNGEVSGTMEVPFGAGYNTIEIQMWWMNECENGVDLTALTVERVTE